MRRLDFDAPNYPNIAVLLFYLGLDSFEHRISSRFNCDLTEKGINFFSADGDIFKLHKNTHSHIMAIVLITEFQENS